MPAASRVAIRANTAAAKTSWKPAAASRAVRRSGWRHTKTRPVTISAVAPRAGRGSERVADPRAQPCAGGEGQHVDSEGEGRSHAVEEATQAGHMVAALIEGEALRQLMSCDDPAQRDGARDVVHGGGAGVHGSGQSKLPQGDPAADHADQHRCCHEETDEVGGHEDQPDRDA